MPGLQRERHSSGIEYERAWVSTSMGVWARACGRVHGCVGGCIGAWVSACMRTGGGGAWVRACGRTCAHLTCILWSPVYVKMGMKASIWEVNMGAAYTTSKMITALRDAILESWKGTLQKVTA